MPNTFHSSKVSQELKIFVSSIKIIPLYSRIRIKLNGGDSIFLSVILVGDSAGDSTLGFISFSFRFGVLLGLLVLLLCLFYLFCLFIVILLSLSYYLYICGILKNIFKTLERRFLYWPRGYIISMNFCDDFA